MQLALQWWHWLDSVAPYCWRPRHCRRGLFLGSLPFDNTQLCRPCVLVAFYSRLCHRRKTVCSIVGKKKERKTLPKPDLLFTVAGGGGPPPARQHGPTCQWLLAIEMRRMFVVLRLRLSSLSRFSTSSLDKFSTSAMDSSICFLCLCPQVDHLFLVT